MATADAAAFIRDVPKYNGVGVYSLTAADGRVYIGSSKNVRNRILSHKTTVKTHKAARALQAIYDSGGYLVAGLVEALPPTTSRYQLREAEARHLARAKQTGAVLNHDIVSLHRHPVGGGYFEAFSAPVRPDLLKR